MAAYPKNHLWYHIAFWLLIFSLWFGLFYVDFGDFTILFYFTSAIVLSQILTSYATTLVLIPKFLYTQKYLWFWISYMGMLAVSSFALGETLVLIAAKGTGKTHAYDDYTDSVATFIYGFMLMLFSNVLVASAKIAYDRFQAESASKQLESEKLELEKEKLATELKFLKAQINPHFLFNSLNSIFNLIAKDPDQARDLLAKFSGMLRYHLYETEIAKIPLETELTYIYNYADMEKVRKGKNIDIRFEVEEGVGYLEIAPLVLLTFVENAFKHVSNYTNRMNSVVVHLFKIDDCLVFRIENTKENSISKTPKTDGGIGIANVKRRLELLYPGAYTLQIDDQADTYTVALKLKVSIR